MCGLLARGTARRRCVSVVLVIALISILSGAARAQFWPGYGRDPQHSALLSTTAQPPKRVRWSTPVDLAPQYSGNDLPIHYGCPLITASNTIIVPVKTGATDGFRVEGHRADTGTTIWTQASDYSLPAHGWTPSFGCAITPNNKVVFPGAGGTIYCRDSPDSATGTLTQLAFFGIANYTANPGGYNANVQICTPITCDAGGNLYFGFVASATAPGGLTSGIARISSAGVGSWKSAADTAVDSTMKKVVYSCTPALSADGSKLYFAVNDAAGSGAGAGYLVSVDSQTLAPVAKAFLTDWKNPANPAILDDDGTASPTVGPDGDVYFGVLENPWYSNHLRGWLLHFSGDLATEKMAGAFGWDDTASIVPASAVPSYAGSSTYLLLTKYNNYVEGGGDGVNKLAILDPNDQMIDPITGECVLKEVLTIAGPTPDPNHRDANHPNAVREWCINTAAIDPVTKGALVNNEDGILYRWDFATNTLNAKVVLTQGIGEAYTPTVVGPDGTVYAINNATLFAAWQPILPGSVLDRNRQPIAGAEVHLYSLEQQAFLPNTATSDASGGFQLSVADIPAGHYHIGAYKAGLNQWIFSPNFRGYAVTDTTGDMPPIDIVLDQTGPSPGGIFGFVRYDDATGAHPIGPGVHVDVYSGGHLVASTDSNANGQYIITNLPAIKVFGIQNWWGWYTYIATWNGHKAAGVNFGVWSGVPIRTDIAFKL